MKKVVINNCYGGFGLSKEAYEFVGLEWDGYGYAFDDKREDIKLIECVEVLKEKANGRNAKLKIVEIPDDVEYEISEHVGIEWVAEKHRTWS